MTRANSILIPVVAAVAAIAALWFLVLAPKREEVAKLDAGIVTQQAALDAARGQIAEREKAKASYRANYATLTRLGKAVPADDDLRSLLLQLDDAAARAEVDFKELSVGSSGTGTAKSSAGALSPAPGTVAVGNAGFSAMPFSFGFTGGFTGLSGFLGRVEQFVSVENDKLDVSGRLLLLGSLSLNVPEGDLSKMQAKIGAVSYLVPSAAAVADAASTPAVPDATTPAAPSTGGTTTTPPTTSSATITGAR